MVDCDLVRTIEPVIVFVINGVGVIRVVPERVVLAELVFEVEVDPEKLVVPVEVLDADMLLVWVGLSEEVFELRALFEYLGVSVDSALVVIVDVKAGVLDSDIDIVLEPEVVTVGARDLVSLIEVRADLVVEADPVWVGVPELVAVTFPTDPVIVGLSFGVVETLGVDEKLVEELAVFEDWRVLVCVIEASKVRLPVVVAEFVLVASLDAVPELEPVPVLLDDIVLVELTDAVPVLELVVVAVDVRVFLIVFDLGGDLLSLGLPVDVFEAIPDRVNEAQAVLVLDCAPDLVPVGELEGVFEVVVVAVVVLVRGPVLDWIDVPVVVFDLVELAVRIEEPEGDLEELDVLVEVIEPVIVFVVVLDWLMAAVAKALRVKVVVLVDVFDWVLVDVGITISPMRTLPDTRFALVSGESL